MSKHCLKRHKIKCYSCRYYRIYTKFSFSSNCLLLGRMLCITNEERDLFYWDSARYCESWKKRPKKWVIKSTKNPFWFDIYIPRQSQIKTRKRVGIS